MFGKDGPDGCSSNTKVQLVCRVALGKFQLATSITRKEDCPLPGYDSVVALPFDEGGRNIELLEMIVYHYLQVLPVLAIHYRHTSLCRCRFCDYCGGCQ